MTPPHQRESMTGHGQPPRLRGVRHRWVDVDGLRVHVAEAGPATGPVVVLLHGWPQHWYCWRGVIAPLVAAGHRVICPDQRGFGWTDAPSSGYAKEQLARDLLGVLDQLDVASADVVGHDWGGIVGYLAALQSPERVRRLVAINTGHPWPSRSVRSLLGSWRIAWYQAGISAPVIGERFARDLLFPLAARGERASGAWNAVAHASYRAQLQEPARARATVQVYRSFLTSELPAWIAGRYASSRLAQPLLALHGDADPVLRPWVLDGLSEHVDDLEVRWLPGVGHFSPEAAPDLVAEHLLSFLAGA